MQSFSTIRLIVRGASQKNQGGGGIHPPPLPGRGLTTDLMSQFDWCHFMPLLGIIQLGLTVKYNVIFGIYSFFAFQCDDVPTPGRPRPRRPVAGRFPPGRPVRKVVAVLLRARPRPPLAGLSRRGAPMCWQSIARN